MLTRANKIPFQAMQKCRASLDLKYQSLYRRFDTVVFCGTPHRASEAATWRQLARNLVAAALQDTNLTLIRDLEVDSHFLELIQDDFRKILREGRIRVHTFQEAQGLTGVRGFSGKVGKDLHAFLDCSLTVTGTGCRQFLLAHRIRTRNRGDDRR